MNPRPLGFSTKPCYLMASSIIDKKSPRRGRRVERQSMDSRRQTRRKHASRTLERLDLSSRYFLKRSKIDISQNVKVSFCDGYGGEPLRPALDLRIFLKQRR
jgi:DnaJ-class molecular chaperone